MKVFLTGGSGFLGRQLIRDLITRGHTVVALARSINAANAVKALGATDVLGSLDNLLLMAEAMTGCNAVIHAAAKVEQWGDPAEFTLVNVTGTKNVTEAARLVNVPRLIYVSTEAVLASGEALINVDETTPVPYFPIGLYPETKGLAEKLVMKAGNKKFAAISVRPRFIWGADDTTLLPKMIREMKEGRWTWFGRGQYKTSTCHVRNASAGILLALEQGEGGQIYFITDGEPVIFRDFITALARTQDTEPPVRERPVWMAEFIALFGEFIWKVFRREGSPPLTRTAVNLFFREVTVSDAKARRELGYTPVITMEEGLAEMTERYNAPATSYSHL